MSLVSRGTLCATCVAFIWLLVLSPSPARVPAAEIVWESVKPQDDSARVVRYGLTRDDLRQFTRLLPNVRQFVPIRTVLHQAAYGEQMLHIRLTGTVSELTSLGALKVQAGRFLLKKDLDKRNNVAVINSYAAARLFPGDAAIGKNVRIADHYFLIVGQIAETETSAIEENRRGQIYIPITTMRSRFGDNVFYLISGSMEAERYELSCVHIVLEPSTNVPRVATIVRSLLKKFHEKPDYSIRVVMPNGRD